MMKIILVEDEPSAMRYLRSIIERKCEGFEIVDTAENGIDGLEKARALKPDVVITDIKMPGMNGIELTSHLKDELPFIYSVIISGYQDFEYARGAIKSGVVDYLLKPVNIAQLKALLNSIHRRLEEDYYERRLLLFKQALSGAAIEAWRLNKYLPFKTYCAAIFRVNGLPSRFPAERPVGSYDFGAFPNISTGDNIWALQGRDEFEMLFFSSPDVMDSGGFETTISDMAAKLEAGYYTLVFVSEPFELQDCKDVVLALYRTLDCNVILGFSQIIRNIGVRPNISNSNAVLDGTIVKRIDFLLSNGMYDELKHEIEKLLALWEEQHYTQLWVETMLRQIFYRIDKCSVNTDYDIEFLLNEAVCYATDYDELKANLWDILDRITGPVKPNVDKIDSPLFFYSIENYLKQNLSQPLSLKSVCARFGISQTYLSRLFRKYKNMSFNEYMTLSRIEEAKKLISDHPDMLLKDVAELVGYNDPFYFSHVFKSITGVSPSKYLSNIAYNK
jgi:YesN/AraC family two-component response regulator